MRPIQAGVAKSPLRPFKFKFAAEVRQIQEAIQHHDMNPALREEVVHQLAQADAAFQAAMETPGEAQYMLDHTTAHGFWTGSSTERIPIEKAVAHGET